MYIAASVLAGGLGKRMSTNTPKQFLEIAGKPIIIQTLEIFDKIREISSIVVAVHKEWIPMMKSIVEKKCFRKEIALVEGGETRQDSSFEAARHYKEKVDRLPDFIVVHDAARCLITEKIICESIYSAILNGAASVAEKVTDTTVITENGNICSFLDREKLRKIQTPQVFKFDLFYNCHEKAHLSGIHNYTDDASLVRSYGYNVAIVKGSEENIKVSNPSDIFIAEEILKNRGGLKNGY